MNPKSSVAVDIHNYNTAQCITACRYHMLPIEGHNLNNIRANCKHYSTSYTRARQKFATQPHQNKNVPLQHALYKRVFFFTYIGIFEIFTSNLTEMEVCIGGING